MRILLATPPLHPYQSYNYKFPRFPILNLTLLAATVKKEHEVRVISHAAHPDQSELLDEAVQEFQPDVVGFALPSPVSAMELKEAVGRIRNRRPEVKIVAGGPFATFEPGFCLDAGCDAVFLPEAEETFPAWIRGGCGTTSGEGAPRGMALRSNEGRNGILGEPAIVENLDSLPVPAWDLLDFKPVIYTGRKAAALEMSRGCPYGCTFCTVHEFGIRYREKSADRILDEMAFLWEKDFRELLFVDNSFALNPQSAYALADGMLNSGWSFEFGAYLRSDTIASHPELMALLAKAGLRYAIVGFESYADDSLDTMNKAAKHEVNIKAAEILRREKIFSIGSHIYGTPGETLSDCKKTYHLGVRHSDLYKAGIFTPLPGSPLYRELKRTHALDTTNPLAMDYVHYQVGESDHRKKIQLLSLFLFLRYFLGPRRLLALVSSDFWTRRIFLIEYHTIVLRVLSMLRRPFKKRAPEPQFDCL